MQRIGEWIDRHWTITWLSMCVVGIVAVALLYGGVAIHAAPAKASEPVPDCVAIGKSGPLVVSKCTDDESGQVIYVDNYGFMLLGQ